MSKSDSMVVRQARADGLPDERRRRRVGIHDKVIESLLCGEWPAGIVVDPSTVASWTSASSNGFTFRAGDGSHEGEQLAKLHGEAAPRRWSSPTLSFLASNLRDVGQIRAPLRIPCLFQAVHGLQTPLVQASQPGGQVAELRLFRDGPADWTSGRCPPAVLQWCRPRAG